MSDNAHRNFFHSFPRPHKGETPDALRAKALAILRMIKEVGLVLAPETVEWHVPLINNTTRSIKYEQLRICFTELSQIELPDHAARFGPFALEFEIKTLREMGALPVIYMPQSTSAGGLSAIGSVLVMELHHVEATMRLLESLRLNSDEAKLLGENSEAHTVAPDCVMNLVNTDDHGNVVSKYSAPLTSVRDILNYIGYKNAPFAEMMNALGYVKSLFYPTDDKNHDQALAYYRQREWRIGRGLTSGGTVHSRLLTEPEKRRLIAIDQRFWERMTGEPAMRRIDASQIITQFNGKPVAESIGRVLVPPDALSVARELFSEKAISFTL